MKITVNLDCKTSYVSKAGEIPLTLRITINRKNDYLPLGRKIKIEQYDAENKKIRSGIKGYSQITSFIRRQEVKVDDIITDLERRGEVITFQKIKSLYNSDTGKEKDINFFSYVDSELKREVEETDIKPSTIKYWEDQRDRVKEFKSSLSIHEIDKTFIEKLVGDLKRKDKSETTRFHVLSFLRKYTKRLYKEGKIKKYPFDDYTVGVPESNEVEYLEPEEITRLHDLYDSGELLKHIKKAKSKYARDFNIGARYQSTLQQALTACYCGFRHSDIKTLHKRDLKNGYIVKQLQKARLGKVKTVRVPIRKRLYSLLDLDHRDGLLFSQPVQENGTTNKYLKEIMKIAGINKKITFHCCRHTFAINSLLLGIKIEVIQDILGHSSLETTQRYARVVDRLRDMEMDKWNKFLKDDIQVETVLCPECKFKVLECDLSIFKQSVLTLSCKNCNQIFDHDLANLEQCNIAAA